MDNRVSKQVVEKTPYFNGLACKVKKAILLQSKSLKTIGHGVTMSKNVGFDKWVQVTHPTPDVKNIVSNLIQE